MRTVEGVEMKIYSRDQTEMTCASWPNLLMGWLMVSM